MHMISLLAGAALLLTLQSPVIAGDTYTPEELKQLEAGTIEIDMDKLSRTIEFEKKRKLAQLDSKYGFRSYKFESAPPKKGLKVVNSAGYNRDYSAGKVSIGTASANVGLRFYKNKLSAISIHTQNSSDSAEVKRVFVEAYGVPDQPNQYIESYIWRGERVGISFQKNSITGKADIVLVSLKMLNQEQAEDEARAKKAADQL